MAKTEEQMAEINERIAAAKAKAKTRFERVNIPKGVKVSYFKFPNYDEAQADQVLCVVRSFDPARREVTFGYSINNPPRWVSTQQSKTKIVVDLKPGDVFCRREGRNAALRNMNHKVSVFPDEYPTCAALRQIVTLADLQDRKNNLADSHLHRTAEHHYLRFPKRETESSLAKAAARAKERMEGKLSPQIPLETRMKETTLVMLGAAIGTVMGFVTPLVIRLFW